MGRVNEAMRRVTEAAAVPPKAPAAGVPPAASAAPTALLDPETAGGDAGQRAAPTSSARAADVPPLLGPDAHIGPAEKVVTDEHMAPGGREQYRRLAAALHHGQAETGLKVVMISSAVASEGKTLTASNLALTLSESYRQSVLLVDADFRRPSLHTFFGTPGSPGLTESLEAVEDQTLPLRRVSPTLTILPAGRPSSDPMAGLTSARMRRLIAEARALFTWVIVDTPPVGLLTDANLLASMVDGTLLVVRAGETPCDLVKRAAEAIGADRILGVVLNSALANAQPYGGYDQYYGYGSQKAAK